MKCPTCGRVEFKFFKGLNERGVFDGLVEAKCECGTVCRITATTLGFDESKSIFRKSEAKDDRISIPNQD